MPRPFNIQANVQNSAPIPLPTYGQPVIRGQLDRVDSLPHFQTPRRQNTAESMNEAPQRSGGRLNEVSDTFSSASDMERGEVNRSRKCIRLNAAFWVNASVITLVCVVAAVTTPSIMKNPDFFNPFSR